MLPRISIITCSYNQGQFIERTIQSVLLQDYANLEHIIVDGMSTDETPTILDRYPHLQVLREPDHGQADAINKGFRRATGDIICFLNSDDTFAPGVLKRVAQEIDVTRNRHIVMGRCQFIDEKDHFTGIEHPSFFFNHHRMLQIWHGYGVPQPAVFWSKEVLRKCGLMNPDEHWVLDYDLFCRFSKEFTFHTIDEVWGHYRLHDHSKTCLLDDNTRFKESIRVSKKYWGSRFSCAYWRLTLSLWQYQRQQWSREQFKKARALFQENKTARGTLTGLLGLILGPELFYYARIRASFLRYFKIQIDKALTHAAKMQKKYPQAQAYRDTISVWDDGHVGPKVQWKLPHPAKTIQITGEMLYYVKQISMQIFINEQPALDLVMQNQKEFTITIPVPANLTNAELVLKILTKEWFIPHHYIKNQDFRPLSWKYLSLEQNL